MPNASQPLIVIAGATGDLGGRIAAILSQQGVRVKALVRSGSSQAKINVLKAQGMEIAEVDFTQPSVLATACSGADCVVSAVSGLEDVIVDLQTQLLNAAVSAGVPRFMPSDFCCDYTRLTPGHNRNLDFRRTFQSRLDAAPIQAVSLLNGMFTDLLKGQAPVVLFGPRRILCWGDPDQPLDFTTIQNTAEAAAATALSLDVPRFVSVAGDVLSPRQLQTVAGQATGTRFKLLRPGSIGRFDKLIWLTRKLAPMPGEIFAPWQGMQYLRDMLSGEAKLSPLDNQRFPEIRWIPVWEVLTEALSEQAA